ncbi:iron-siderophore ABC transporter substrate-binding protein [Cyanobacteria bacterium FACHB-472]|nr:iron-siderophore ABC transporter substrate-binding protein [Cyanobacteria bacterium FACHB-472]
MNSFSRRQFIATAIASALVVACTKNQTETEGTSAAPQAQIPNLKSPAKRIVALEWVYVEDLLALGIQPVGVADISEYKKYVDIQPKLAENVVDVGTRQEPSLEAIAKLEPDLIIGIKLRHESIYNNLSSIAPTLLFNPYPAANELSQLEEMQQTFIKIAETVNRREAGVAVLQQMQETFKTAAEQLRLTGASSSFILGQFLPELRLFTDNAMAVEILEKIGLQNAWKGKFDSFGFNTVGLEALPEVEQANFLYMAENNQIPWQNNPVWKGLNFVKENRVYPIGEDTWFFGGPLSAQVLVEKVVAALTKKR